MKSDSPHLLNILSYSCMRMNKHAAWMYEKTQTDSLSPGVVSSKCTVIIGKRVIGSSVHGSLSRYLSLVYLSSF